MTTVLLLGSRIMPGVSLCPQSVFSLGEHFKMVCVVCVGVYGWVVYVCVCLCLCLRSRICECVYARARACMYII